MTINNGATSTPTANVTLALTALGGVSRMWISNNPSFATSTGTGWIPFQASYPWTLAGSGEQTVFAEFALASTTTSEGSVAASILVGSPSESLSSPSGTLSELLSLLTALRSLVIQLLASTNNRPLTIGSTGTDVWALQVFLEIDGAGPASAKLAAIGPTGTFGTITQAALAEYQTSQGITPAQGYFGPKTRAVILGGTPVPPTMTNTPTPATSSNPPFTKNLSYGMTDPEVSILQQFLARDPSVYPQGLVTGYYGTATQQAVQEFQLNQTLSIPSQDYGQVDAITRAKLNVLYVGGGMP
jgi:peptidoglycan hydrolase-like protein with peptidoglycan-binding domain